MLAASPMAKGLFHDAISQSGGSFGPTDTPTYPRENTTALAHAEADGLRYAESVGASSTDELRQMKAEDVIPKGWSMPGGWPIVDGYVIPGDQFELYEQGRYNDVPVLVGYNSDEGLSFVRSNDPNSFIEDVKSRFGKFSEPLIEAYEIGRASC